MDVNEAKRLKELEEQNRQLKQMVADLSLDNRGLEVCARKKVVSPAARREVVEHFRAAYELSERRACRLVGLSRSVQRYTSRRTVYPGLEDRLLEHAGERPSLWLQAADDPAVP